MAPPPTLTRIRAAKALGRALIASVFLVAGAMKLQEVASSLSQKGAGAVAGAGARAGAGAGAGAGAAAPLPATLAYASRRLDLVLASLGAPASVPAVLRPHHAILCALVGLGEVAAAGAFVAGRPWAAPALLGLLLLVTPVAHCFWLLPPGSASAGLELGHVIKNAAIAGALVLEWVSASAAGGAGGARRGGEGPPGALVGKDE